MRERTGLMIGLRDGMKMFVGEALIEFTFRKGRPVLRILAPEHVKIIREQKKDEKNETTVNCEVL